MTDPVRAFAATMQAVWFSDDLGESWNRPHTQQGGFYNEARAWSVVAHPERPAELWCGTDVGIYRWEAAAGRWEHVPSPLDGFHVQQLAIDPRNPQVIYAGTRPAQVWQSLDGGESWNQCALGIDSECYFINTPRVTSINFEPWPPYAVWVTIEIAGPYRSEDGGKTWTHLPVGLKSIDTHNTVFCDDGQEQAVLITTEEGLHRSADHGVTWTPVPVPQSPWPYMRCMIQRQDAPGYLLLSVGDKPSGMTGKLLRSRDFGASWEEVDLPARVNSTIWWIGQHPADPKLIIFCTIFGQIFRTTDGGESWDKLTRELGEIRMIGWAPTA
ncbi:MAG: hypothetical protein JJU42_01540 [Rhodobacteraceae bacterium]|nr:hypothetical protein [Paracoccaceae bacterium]